MQVIPVFFYDPFENWYGYFYVQNQQLLEYLFIQTIFKLHKYLEKTTKLPIKISDEVPKNLKTLLTIY